MSQERCIEDMTDFEKQMPYRKAARQTSSFLNLLGISHSPENIIPTRKTRHLLQEPDQLAFASEVEHCQSDVVVDGREDVLEGVGCQEKREVHVEVQAAVNSRPHLSLALALNPTRVESEFKELNGLPLAKLNSGLAI